ncbi:MAG: polysaccharide biosynthesis C-terminal domain-containing protein, partial [Rhodobacteraceae bacterium]|nr:polysaccharide biosynthesis C-terminal domain-containing protein [Paracoccaceae bacterium]
VMQKSFQPLFFAREDTRRPFLYALVAMVLNAIIAIGLSPYIGYIAAAVATTVAGWTMALQLWLGARSMGTASQFDARFKQRIWRIIAASGLMGAVLWLAAMLMLPLLTASGLRYIALAVLVAIGLVSYGIFGQLLGAFRLSEFKRALKRN